MPDLATTFEAAGLDSDAAYASRERLSRIVGALRDARPGSPAPASAWFVPGRIEVFGKHTDYAGGRSLVCAASRGFCIVASPRPDGALTITDLGRGSTLTTTVEAPNGSGEHWFTYPLTVLRRLARNFPGRRTGADIVFESDLPPASGMSSSSALMIAIFLALADVEELQRRELWRRELGSREDVAAYLATIENGQTFKSLTGDDAGVGTAGGSEDHTAILCSAAARLGQFRFCPIVQERSVPLPDGLLFAVAVSGVTARKTGEARAQYNRAAEAAARLLAYWRQDTGRNDASLAAALESAPDARDRLRRALADARDEEFGSALLLERLDHFVEESMVLVPSASDCLARGDLDGFGNAAERSQELAERWLRNQVPETASLARAARASGALAASAFGAGFGGSVWALVPAEDAARFLDRWKSQYQRGFPDAARRALFFTTRPGPAAFRVAVSS